MRSWEVFFTVLFKFATMNSAPILLITLIIIISNVYLKHLLFTATVILSVF